MNFSKTFTFFTILIMLPPIQMFSQARNKIDSRLSNLLPERVYSNSIPHMQVKHPSESNILKNGESRTIVNNTILNNGFLLAEEISQGWWDSSWVNINKQTFTYDDNNNKIEYLYQEWDDSNWVNINKQTFTYDGNNNKIEWLFQSWDGSSWENEYKRTYTYDENNNMIEEFGQTWEVSYWWNWFKRTYIYDANNNMIEELLQKWDGSNLVNYRKRTYIYDANNNMIEELEQGWDGSNWVISGRHTFTYDGNNNMIELLAQIWHGSNWKNSWRIIYIYIPMTGIDQLTDVVINYSLSNNYPNPFNPSTTIKFDLPKTSEVTLKICNILGEEVATLASDRLSAGTYSYDWDASNMASGVYLYRLEAGDYVETKKMILMR